MSTATRTAKLTVEFESFRSDLPDGRVWRATTEDARGTRTYFVTFFQAETGERRGSCMCPDFTFDKMKKRRPCKHLKQAAEQDSRLFAHVISRSAAEVAERVNKALDWRWYGK